MSTTVGPCPKCSGEMIQGFLMERAPGAGRVIVQWLEGPPAQSFWMGLKLPDQSKTIPVGSFRCSGCGFLESYARPEFAPS